MPKNKSKPKGSGIAKAKSGQQLACFTPDQYSTAAKNTKDSLLKESTRDNYTQAVRHARTWLVKTVEQDRALERSADPLNAAGKAYPPGYEDAFGDIPNCYSAEALETFILFKCVLNNKSGADKPCGWQTGDRYYSAMKNVWDFQSGYNDKYRGPWVIDDATGHCKGNPALAANVQDLIRSLHKSKDISNRKHAKAISIEDMRKSYEKAISILGPNFDNHRIYRKHIDTDPEARKAWLECIKALFMLVFSVTAFTVWSRTFELARVKVGDVKLNQTSPTHHRGRLFHSISLTERKGWTGTSGDSETLRGNVYNIPAGAETDTPWIDLHTLLPIWLEVYAELLGRKLQPDDYLFPHISVCGRIEPDKSISHDSIAKWIDWYHDMADVVGRFTSHCYRRGGAQYKFMWAPIGKRFSLTTVRWWGGWADGEDQNTLMRYLLDTLASYENDHSFALFPNAEKPSQSFMGEADLVAPVTRMEYREGQDVSQRNTARILEMLSAIALTLSSPSHLLQSASTSAIQMLGSGLSSVGQYTTLGTSSVISHGSPSASDKAPSPPLIPPHQRIPTIPRGMESAETWRFRLDQWYKPALGCQISLKDWPKAWYSGVAGQVNAMTYRNIQVLAEEYERYGKDDDKFMSAFDTTRGWAPLVREVREAQKARGAIKSRSCKRSSPRQSDEEDESEDEN